MIGYDPYGITSAAKQTNSDRSTYLASVDDLYWQVFKAMVHAHAKELGRLEAIEYERASSEENGGYQDWWLEGFNIAQPVARHLLDVAKVRERIGEPDDFEQIVDFILLYVVDPVLGRSQADLTDEQQDDVLEYRIAYEPVGPVSLAADHLSDSDREYLARNSGYIRRWSRSLQDPVAVEQYLSIAGIYTMPIVWDVG